MNVMHTDNMNIAGVSSVLPAHLHSLLAHSHGRVEYFFLH